MIVGVTSVFADVVEPSYIKGNLKAGRDVMLYNDTAERYDVNATFKGEVRDRRYYMALEPMGSGFDIIQFPIQISEYAVCLDVIHKYTRQYAFTGCLPPGWEVRIHYMGGKAIATAHKV